MAQLTAIRFHKTGGPEVLGAIRLPVAVPGPGEVLIRQTAIGVNFIDTYHRSGLYPVALPCTPGMEAAGIVEAVGEGVEHVAPGDRCVYFAPSPGAYATHRVIDSRWLVKLPADIPDEAAAAGWLKACTTEFLVERCARVQAGDTVVVTAAAGGMGLLLCQWLRAVGAHVIAVAGTADKRALALAQGAEHAIGYEAMAAEVRRLTGEGADMVIDGVGKATFLPALDALRRRGLLVSFGNASGPVGAVDFALLAQKGSLFATRPTLFDYYATPEDFALGTSRVFAMWPKLSFTIGQRYSLLDAARCHADLEARATTGASLLIA